YSPLLGTGFVDEDNAGVKIALISGDALVDRIGNDVCDAPPIVRRGIVLFAAQLLPGEHVPQPELGLEAPVRLRDTASHQRLSVDLPPVAKPWQGVDGDNFLDIGGLIDRREQAGAAQVRGDDLAYTASTSGVGQPDRDEIRNR